MSEQTDQATREELTARCGHECLNQPDHDGPHFYGYRMGRYSYEGLLAENDRLRAAIDRLVDLTLTQIDTPVKHGRCDYCEAGSEPTKVRYVTPAVDVPGWDGTRHEHSGVPVSADEVYNGLRPEDEYGWDAGFAREVADALVALRDACG